MTADYVFGKALEKNASDVVKANGGQVLGAVLYLLSASDFSSFLLQAQGSKTQVLGLANAGGDTMNSIKAAKEFGITKTMKIAALLIFLAAPQPGPRNYAKPGAGTGTKMQRHVPGHSADQEDADEFSRSRLLRGHHVSEGGEAAGTTDSDKVMD